MIKFDDYKMKVTKARADRYTKCRKARLYIFESGETVLENLQNRHDRPRTEYRKLLPEIFLKLNNPPRKDFSFEDFTKNVTWSQTAGCACGCSPGFIFKNIDYLEFFVDVKTTKSAKLKGKK